MVLGSLGGTGALVTPIIKRVWPQGKNARRIMAIAVNSMVAVQAVGDEKPLTRYNASLLCVLGSP